MLILHYLDKKNLNKNAGDNHTSWRINNIRTVPNKIERNSLCKNVFQTTLCKYTFRKKFQSVGFRSSILKNILKNYIDVPVKCRRLCLGEWFTIVMATLQ